MFNKLRYFCKMHEKSNNNWWTPIEDHWHIGFEIFFCFCHEKNATIQMISHKIRPVEYRTVLRETVFPSKLSLVCVTVQKFQTGMTAF